MFKTLFIRKALDFSILSQAFSRAPSRFIHDSMLKPCFFIKQTQPITTIEILSYKLPCEIRLFRSTTIKLCEAETPTEPKKNNIDPSKLRFVKIPPEVSIRYMKSAAYKTTYGDEPVWVKYRRNFKGHYVPRKTRESCIRKGIVMTGNPCPICRDEYLVLHYTNTELLKQFIHTQTGEIRNARQTHICRRKLFLLEVEVAKAKFFGYLKYEVPFREYNYDEYYPEHKNC